MNEVDILKNDIEVLNKIDVMKYIDIGDEPEDIMFRIQCAYEDHELDESLDEIVEDVLNGSIFEFMTTEDFMRYCTYRYNILWGSEVRYWVNGVDS
jgi:hypothetical protein